MQDAITQRKDSRAVLYSDLDVVWVTDPLPQLESSIGSYDVIAAQDNVLMSTSFFVLNTRYGTNVPPCPCHL